MAPDHWYTVVLSFWIVGMLLVCIVAEFLYLSGKVKEWIGNRPSKNVTITMEEMYGPYAATRNARNQIRQDAINRGRTP